MKIFIRRLLLFTSIIVTISAIAIQPGGRAINNSAIPDSRSIINELFKNIENINTLTYTIVYSERLNEGKIHTDSNLVKYQKEPWKIYVKTSDETEILWPANANREYAWVHPNSFPYITLKLDPDGAIMRKNQHHGVQSCGFEYFGNVLKNDMNKAGKNFNSHFIYLGEIQYNGITCYKLDVIEPSFKYVPYTPAKGETIMSIAGKLMLSEYMILQHNNLSSYSSIVAGQTIMVPNNYAREMVLYIDKSSMLPVFIKIDDDKGLFEQYIFRNVNANTTLTAEEFSKENKNYHF
ncbi:MAG: DUF1571 domain-containing protein [Bacteroidia bacterium]